MNKGLRDFIEQLERDMPSHVIRVKKEVSPEFEIPAILQHVESRKKKPVLIFEKVRNLKGTISELPVVINLFGSRERLADSDRIDGPEPSPGLHRQGGAGPAGHDRQDQGGGQADYPEGAGCRPVRVTHRDPSRDGPGALPHQSECLDKRSRDRMDQLCNPARLCFGPQQLLSPISMPRGIRTTIFRSTGPSSATYPSFW